MRRVQGIKFKQGLFLEGTGICFHLSHQRWVNSGGSSAAAGLLKPCQLCPPACCTAGPGGEAAEEESCPCRRLPRSRGSRDNPGQGHSSCEQLHLVLPGGSGAFQHCPSGAACPVLADPGPRRAVTNQSVSGCRKGCWSWASAPGGGAERLRGCSCSGSCGLAQGSWLSLPLPLSGPAPGFSEICCDCRVVGPLLASQTHLLFSKFSVF